MTIADIVRSLGEAEDQESIFLVAATLNLYSEAIRRKAGRTLFTPTDVRELFAILSKLLAVETQPVDYRPPRRIRPSGNEEETICKALEAAIAPEAQP